MSKSNKSKISINMIRKTIEIRAIIFVHQIRLNLSILVLKIQKRIWTISYLRKIYLLIDKLNCPHPRFIHCSFMKKRYIIVI